MLPEQRRDVSRLMTAAGIHPESASVRPDDDTLARVTGAREPSGVPVTIVAPQASQPARRRSVPAAIARTADPASGDGTASGAGRAAHRASGRPRRPRRPRGA